MPERLLLLNKKVLIKEVERKAGGVCSGRILNLPPRSSLNGKGEGVKAGDIVLFDNHSAHHLVVNGEMLVLINIEDLFGVLVNAE